MILGDMADKTEQDRRLEDRRRKVSFDEPDRKNVETTVLSKIVSNKLSIVIFFIFDGVSN